MFQPTFTLGSLIVAGTLVLTYGLITRMFSHKLDRIERKLNVLLKHLSIDFGHI